MRTSRTTTAITHRHDKQSRDYHLPIIVEIANQQELLSLDESRLRDGIRAVLVDEGITNANISVAVVDDATIKEINAQFLQHDWATDVISFVLEQRKGFVEGEIIISAETAAASAGQFGWKADDELLLYAVHGALHLVGYDDQTPATRKTMRERERAYLAQFGLRPRYEDSPS